MTKMIVLLKNGKRLKIFSNRDSMLDWIEDNTKCEAEIMFYDFRYATLTERLIVKLLQYVKDNSKPKPNFPKGGI